MTPRDFRLQAVTFLEGTLTPGESMWVDDGDEAHLGMDYTTEERMALTGLVWLLEQAHAAGGEAGKIEGRKQAMLPGFEP